MFYILTASYNNLPAIGFKRVSVKLVVARRNVGHHRVTACHGIITARVAEEVCNNMNAE